MATSRFVSGGAIDAASGEAVSVTAATGDQGTAASPHPRQQAQTQTPAQHKRAAEWEAVQRDLDAERRRREEQRRAQGAGAGGEERSLYEVLQANKAAKQAAFEEANAIKNQFRPLDDDEIDFLDGVRQSARAEEDRVRRETEDGVDLFRAEQAGRGRAERRVSDVAGGGDSDDEVEGQDEWTALAGGGRKRKRRENHRVSGSIIKGVKRSHSDGTSDNAAGATDKKLAEEPDESTHNTKGPTTAQDKLVGGAPASVQISKPKPKMGLVDYGSDDDDD